MSLVRFNNEFKKNGEIDKEIYQIEPNVFVSESRANSGETIYLRMELITEKNKPYIDQYLRQVRSPSVSGDGRCGLLSYLTRYIEPVGADKYAFTANSTELSWEAKWSGNLCPLDKIKELSGYSDEELQELIQWMGKNGFHSKNEKRPDLHDTICGAGFLISIIEPGYYFVYASKNPEFCINKTTLVSKETPSTLKNFISQYKDLLICVGSTYCEESSYSRGIFRNPITVIDKTYKRTSLALLGFSGAVAYRFLNKKTIYIGPVARMPGILCSALRNDEFVVKGMSASDVRKKAASKKAFFDQGGGFTIQLAALNRIFKESQRSNAEIAEDKQKAQVDKHYQFFKTIGFSGFSLMAVGACVHARKKQFKP